MDNFSEDAYETDEGGDVRPAVLHEWIRTISNHVCDVLVETVRTFGNQTVSKVSLKYPGNIKTVGIYRPYTQPMLTDWQRERRSKVVPLQT